MLGTVVSISIGAAAGALLRYGLGTRLNALYPAIPMGTLASNLIGGYVVGLAVAYFATRPDLPPEWRLLIITGFCGGLTTFSTFSAEVVALMQQGDPGRAIAAIALHLAGSLAMTVLGLATWSWISAR